MYILNMQKPVVIAMVDKAAFISCVGKDIVSLICSLLGFGVVELYPIVDNAVVGNEIVGIAVVGNAVVGNAVVGVFVGYNTDI